MTKRDELKIFVMLSSAKRVSKHALKAQASRSSRDRKCQPLSNELIGAAGLFAGLVGAEDLGLDRIERRKGPGPRLAQKLAFSLPKHADRFGGFG